MKLSIKYNCRPNFTSRYRHTTPAKVTQSCPGFWEANSSKQCSSPGRLWAQERRPHSLLFWERQTRSVSYQWRTSEMSQTCRICCNTRCKRGCENWQVRCVYSLCHLILETRAEIQRSSTTPRGGGKILALLAGTKALVGLNWWHLLKQGHGLSQTEVLQLAREASPGQRLHHICLQPRDEPPQAPAHTRSRDALKITHCFS